MALAFLQTHHIPTPSRLSTREITTMPRRWASLCAFARSLEPFPGPDVTRACPCTGFDEGLELCSWIPFPGALPHSIGRLGSTPLCQPYPRRAEIADSLDGALGVQSLDLVGPYVVVCINFSRSCRGISRKLTTVSYHLLSPVLCFLSFPRRISVYSYPLGHSSLSILRPRA